MQVFDNSEKVGADVVLLHDSLQKIVVGHKMDGAKKKKKKERGERRERSGRKLNHTI